MFKDLNTADKKTGEKLVASLLVDKFSEEKKLNPQELILIQIPPFLEHYTSFILDSATKANFNRHLGWLTSSLDIHKNTVSESIMVDFIRYLLIKVQDPPLPPPGTSGVVPFQDRVHRWLMLGWLLKFIKNDTYRTLAKQALFFDWLHFDGDKNKYKMFEPCWLTIVKSLGKYKEMSQELLEFLFLYTRE